MEKLKQVLPHSPIDNAPTFINLLLTVCLLTLTTLGISCSRGALLDSAQAALGQGRLSRGGGLLRAVPQGESESDKAEFARLRVATIYQRDLKRYDRAIEHYIHFIEEFPNRRTSSRRGYNSATATG